jgi:DNA repair protein RadC
MKRKVDRCLVSEVREEVFIDTPQEAGEYLLKHVFTPFEQFEQEECWVFTLNCRRRITHRFMVYRGTISAIRIRPAELFRAAIRLNAWGVLLAHNHPSGCAVPSGDDLQMHQTLCQAGELLGMEVVDHLVVGRDAWTSLRQIGG